jgi:hypothetical protein
MARYSTEYIRRIYKKYKKTVNPGFEYKSSKDKVPYTCDVCGYEHSMLLRNLNSGGYGRGYKDGCPKCIKEKKPDYSISLYESFELEGYKIVKIEGDSNKNCYIHSICPNGHRYKIRKDYWYRGHRCGFCKKLEKNPFRDTRLFIFKGSPLLTMCDIKEVAHDYGFRLLSVGKYDGDSNNKLNFECIYRGHEIKLSVNDLRNKKKCCECEREDLFKEIKKAFKDNGYTLLTNLEEKYKGIDTWLECIHSKCGYKFKTSWERFGYHKNRCLKCQSVISGIKRSGSNSSLWKNYSKEDIEKSYNYRANVSQITEQNYKKYKDIINPSSLDRTRGEYSLDHIYPVMEGFRNNIPPEVISNPNNLQMLLEKVNIAKSDKLNISLEELYNGYNSWNGRNEDK